MRRQWSVDNVSLQPMVCCGYSRSYRRTKGALFGVEVRTLKLVLPSRGAETGGRSRRCGRRHAEGGKHSIERSLLL